VDDAVTIKDRLEGYETRTKRKGLKGYGRPGQKGCKGWRMGMKELAERAKVAEITINLKEKRV
jgi:hypothetical protein